MGRASNRRSQREEYDILVRKTAEYEILLNMQKVQLDALVAERQYFKSLEAVCESLRPPIKQITAIIGKLDDVRTKLRSKGIKLT